ncbi:MAG: hypothetical protein KAR07_04295 [Spirochaetes bacterium]|nr:hypothetical protein [Spirochaetota bacterium]
MSQVIMQFVSMPLEDDIGRILSDNGHIIIAEHSNVSEIYFEKVFPKETHYRKSGESSYSEYVHKYQIKEIIKSDKFKPEEFFWVRNEPNYSLSDIKKYHESGLSRSPVILERKPKYPVNGKQEILFIERINKENKKFPEIYNIITREGIEAKKEINEILNRKEKKWWQFWK